MKHTTELLKAIYLSEKPISPKELSEIYPQKSKVQDLVGFLVRKKLVDRVYTQINTGVRGGVHKRVHYIIKDKKQALWLLKRDGAL